MTLDAHFSQVGNGLGGRVKEHRDSFRYISLYMLISSAVEEQRGFADNHTNI